MADRKILIGTYTLKEAREVQQFFECAAWERRYMMEPGEYQLICYPRWIDNHWSIGHTLYAPFTGQITYATFQSRIGSFYGSDKGPEEVGTLGSYSLGFSPFGTVKGDITTPPGMALNLGPVVCLEVWQPESLGCKDLPPGAKPEQMWRINLNQEYMKNPTWL